MTTRHPWAAASALLLGFFMLLVDSTIVSVANPSIMSSLHTDITSVLWVTSAYLLALAVPLLICGRMGDLFGPKNIFLIGLAIFTAASAACGFSTTITALIISRAVQGLGAALMSPQPMAVFTRIFPPDRRGAAMGLWGATAGVAMLVGPLMGGLLVDAFGWQWVFFVNVPVGIGAIIATALLVPQLERHPHRLDWFGISLSAIGMFLLVFGLQEAQRYSWGRVWGPITVWSMIITGALVIAVFVWWQSRIRTEPLVPLQLFRDRNFALGNIVITFVGFTVTSMSIPMMFFYQIVRGLTPIQSALTLMPMAVVAGVLSPITGKLTERLNPRWMAVFGLTLMAGFLVWYALLFTPTTPIGWVLIPSAIAGVANAFIWGPIAIMTTRNLAPADAGAGSGVYNVTRQIGAVIGSAAITALVEARIAANLPGHSGSSATDLGLGLPTMLHAGFSTAMAQSLLLPAAIALAGAIAACWFVNPRSKTAEPAGTQPTPRR